MEIELNEQILFNAKNCLIKMKMEIGVRLYETVAKYVKVMGISNDTHLEFLDSTLYSLPNNKHLVEESEQLLEYLSNNKKEVTEEETLFGTRKVCKRKVIGIEETLFGKDKKLSKPKKVIIALSREDKIGVINALLKLKNGMQFNKKIQTSLF